MSKNKLEILSNMAYFAKCKKYAIKNILKFEAPLTDEQGSLMNIFYNAYFTYWLGLIDYLTKEICFLIEQDVINLVDSEDNYYYLRNLRNAVVHRAEDFANKGTVIKNMNIVVPFSPVNITDQSGKKVYQPFYLNLIQIIIKCEEINHICLNLIKQNDLINYPDLTQDEFINRRKGDPYIPYYVKTDEISEESWKHYLKVKDEMKQVNVNRILSYFETNYLFENVIEKI